MSSHIATLSVYANGFLLTHLDQSGLLSEIPSWWRWHRLVHVAPGVLSGDAHHDLHLAISHKRGFAATKHRSQAAVDGCGCHLQLHMMIQGAIH